MADLFSVVSALGEASRGSKLLGSVRWLNFPGVWPRASIVATLDKRPPSLLIRADNAVELPREDFVHSIAPPSILHPPTYSSLKITVETDCSVTGVLIYTENKYKMK